MRFKDHILQIVKEEHPLEKGMEYRKLSAVLQDAITDFLQVLTPAQRVQFDQTILQEYDKLMDLQYEFVCYATFDEVTKAWRTLVLDSDYISSLEEIIE